MYRYASRGSVLGPLVDDAAHLAHRPFHGVRLDDRHVDADSDGALDVFDQRGAGLVRGGRCGFGAPLDPYRRAS